MQLVKVDSSLSVGSAAPGAITVLPTPVQPIATLTPIASPAPASPPQQDYLAKTLVIGAGVLGLGALCMLVGLMLSKPAATVTAPPQPTPTPTQPPVIVVPSGNGGGCQVFCFGGN